MHMDKETEMLAAFVHGALAFGHLLGFIYNLRRKNWKTAGFHLSAFTFDLWATFIHLRERSRANDPIQPPAH
jgi:vacuolar-type H+-ATPase subunit I/STV1